MIEFETLDLEVLDEKRTTTGRRDGGTRGRRATMTSDILAAAGDECNE